MKKALLFLLVTMLLFTVAFAENMIDPAVYEGKWTLKLISSRDFNLLAPEYGLEMILTLQGDGTAILFTSADGETDEASCTWIAQETGVLLTTPEVDETVPLRYVDNQLLMELEDLDLVFVNDSSQPAAGTSAQHWALEKVEKGGMFYTPDVMGFNMTVDFAADGTAVVNTGSDTSGTYSVDENGVYHVIAGGEAIDYVPVDGALTCQIGSMTLYLTSGESTAPVTPSEPVPEPEPEPTAEPRYRYAVSITPEEAMGLWTLHHITEDGVDYMMNQFGVTMTIQLNEDGSGTVYDGEETKPCTWSIVGGDTYITIDRDVELFLYDGDFLTYDDGDSVLAFLRTEQPKVQPTPEPMPEPTPEPAPEPAPVAADPDYVGNWYCIYMHTGGATGNPQTMWNLMIELELNPDGTASMNYGDPDGDHCWYYDAENGRYYYGSNTDDSPDTPLSFTKEGYLQYGTYLSGYLIFSRDPADVATILPEEPIISTPIPATSTPAPTPVAPVSGSSDFMGAKYVCTSAVASGVSLDVAILGGEYSVIFNADSSAALTIAGITVPNLTWTADADGVITIDYYGNPLVFTPTATGFDLDYFGSMTMSMERE